MKNIVEKLVQWRINHLSSMGLSPSINHNHHHHHHIPTRLMYSQVAKVLIISPSLSFSLFAGKEVHLQDKVYYYVGGRGQANNNTSEIQCWVRVVGGLR